jgi:hypothetical protein
MQNGWISLHRKIRDNWIWEDPVKLKWWIDILLEVNHEPKNIIRGLSVINCDRGQTIRSLQGWSERWNVSRSCVRHFLKLLQDDKMIQRTTLRTETRTLCTQITICNYDNYQIPAHSLRTVEKQERATNNKGKQLNKKEEPILILKSGPTR